jgi:molecular chaperone GrpE
VVRDRRRIDPETGAVREHAVHDELTADALAEPDGGSAPDGAGLTAELRGQLAERTADLQRVSAEYANYRKRVERDRAVAGERATATVLVSLLPVLDDLERARNHGDLTGAFGTVADQLTGIVGKYGLAAFGEKGDPFDPTCHEAVMHSTSSDVTVPTCVDVFRRGYSLGERLLRPAMVAVADPDDPSRAPQDEVADVIAGGHRAGHRADERCDGDGSQAGEH